MSHFLPNCQPVDILCQCWMFFKCAVCWSEGEDVVTLSISPIHYASVSIYCHEGGLETEGGREGERGRERG